MTEYLRRGRGGDDALRGVALRTGQAGGVRGDLRVDRDGVLDEGIAGLYRECDEVLCQQRCAGELAKADSCGKLPCAGRGDEEHLFLLPDGSLSGARQASRLRPRPDHGICGEQDSGRVENLNLQVSQQIEVVFRMRRSAAYNSRSLTFEGVASSTGVAAR